MKPLSLRLRAFGAYAGEHEVPFAELADLGLFTVTGPTGSGKTTIFDAMAYALYGGVPGERPTAEVRSHHADPDVVTEVRLEFEVRGERWAVERRPEQTVMGTRKLRRQAAEAFLFRWSGGRWQGVETGPRRVDPRVEDLVGLNLHQFERVLLLPQGRFQQFLLSGTKERGLLLRHLFGTEVYRRATDALLARAGALRDQLAASDETVRHHRANALAALAELHTLAPAVEQPNSHHSGPAVDEPAGGGRPAPHPDEPAQPGADERPAPDPDEPAGGREPAPDPDEPAGDGEPAPDPDEPAGDGEPAPDLDEPAVDEIRARLDARRPSLDVREAALHAAEVELAAAQLAAQRAIDLAERWRRRADWQRRQRVHAAEAEQIAAARVTLERAERAQPVVAAETAHIAAAGEFQTAGDTLARARLRLDRALHATGLALDPPAPTPASAPPNTAIAPSALPVTPDHASDVDASDVPVSATTLARAIDATRAAAADLAAAHAAGEHHAGLVQRRADLDAEIEALLGQLAAFATEAGGLRERAAALEPVAALLAGRELQADRAERQRRQRQQFETAQQHVQATTAASAKARVQLDDTTRRFVSGFAPRLAAALAPGDPCPVCGAVEHPAPAAGHPDASVGPSDLEAARERAHEAMAAEGRALSSLHLLAVELGEAASIPLAEVEHAAGQAARDRQASHEAADAMRRGDQRLAAIERRTVQIEAQRSELEVQRARLDEQLLAAAAEQRRLAPIVDAWRTVDLDARLAALDRAERTLAQVDELTRRVQLAEARAADAAAARDDAVAASGFDTVHDAIAAVVDPQRAARLRSNVEQWQREAAEIEANLSALDDTELPETEPDPTALQHDVARRQSAVAAERQAVLALGHALTRGLDACGEAERELRRAAPRRAEHALAETVARTCNGQGPTRIALESWVLASELERVTAAANVHLARMSAGRYRLARTDDAGHAGRQAGLDLAVLDSHTGRQRPPSTLSGGEQFQASLALALGLADVVGNTADASAAGFDALFVDEGFGSLDADALDLAIAALDELRGGGRMVGVITHVEAMKAALPTGVEVTPRPDGAGSTLRALRAPLAAARG